MDDAPQGRKLALVELEKALERCTPAELRVAHDALLALFKSFPDDGPKNSSSILFWCAWLVRYEGMDQRALLDAAGVEYDESDTAGSVSVSEHSLRQLRRHFKGE